MTYYNFHAAAKHLIHADNCIGATIFKTYRHISPALVLYFRNHAPIPIREYRWAEYLALLEEKDIEVMRHEDDE